MDDPRGEMVSMSQAWMAVLFEEWKRRYDADPDEFMNCNQFEADPPATYGEAAARYFWNLDHEMGEPNG